MDIQTRKILFIQEVLRLKNEEIIKKLETILHQERKKMSKKVFKPMSLNQLNELIDRAEDDVKNKRLYSSEEVLNEIDAWK